MRWHHKNQKTWAFCTICLMDTRENTLMIEARNVTLGPYVDVYTLGIYFSILMLASFLKEKYDGGKKSLFDSHRQFLPQDYSF
ncbi:hypothetical protein CR513_04562, partial [Mucuna pruriens]